MGPKKDGGDAKKEIMIEGTNITALTDEQLLEFQAEYHKKLDSAQKENSLLEVELNMLRNAWELTEDKVNQVEVENVMIRRELDQVREKMDPTQRKKQDEQVDKNVVYNIAKDALQKLDQVPLNDEDTHEVEDPESVYDSKPSDTEERFYADVRHIKVNQKLKTKRKKLEAKVNELKALYVEMEATVSDKQAQNETSTVSISVPATAPTQTTSPKLIKVLSTEGLVQIDANMLEEIALEEGTISSGSDLEQSKRSIFGLSANTDDALADLPPNISRPLSPQQQTVENLALLRERKWKRGDCRYDDTDECDSNEKIDSDNEHIFDNYQTMLEESVEDPVHFYQTRKWLEYDYETLVREMKAKIEKQIQAMNHVWTKDVKNVMCTQLAAVRNYNADLREDIKGRIKKETERTESNKEHLRLLLQGLEEVRIKMICKRHATNMSIAKQQTEELNYLIQDSYDQTINELQALTNLNFNLSQLFFMRSTENDISLIHKLHSEQQRVKDNVSILKTNVDNARKELGKIKKPLEEYERITRWMETTIAALQKDMRSKKDQEHTNSRMNALIQRIQFDTASMRSKNMMIEESCQHINRNLEEISKFKVNNKNENGFKNRLRQMTAKNKLKILNLKRKIKDNYQVSDLHLRMIRSQVLKNVGRSKTKKWHNLLGTKAFNELVTQFDLRAREHHMKYIGIDKLAIPYRKTSGNILTTFDEKKKMTFPYLQSDSNRT